jgi:hypothetical protein
MMVDTTMVGTIMNALSQVRPSPIRHRTFLFLLLPHHSNTRQIKNACLAICLKAVLGKDMMVDTTMVGTIMNALSQVRASSGTYEQGYLIPEETRANHRRRRPGLSLLISLFLYLPPCLDSSIPISRSHRPCCGPRLSGGGK